VTADSANPLLFHAVVGSPLSDGPSSANLTATLNDASGALVATDAEAIVVTAGDPSAIAGINIEFPADIPDVESPTPARGRGGRR
jgi:hypothetical protein